MLGMGVDDAAADKIQIRNLSTTNVPEEDVSENDSDMGDENETQNQTHFSEYTESNKFIEDLTTLPGITGT